MFCNRCGTPVRPGDRFCPRCGAAIDPDRPVSNLQIRGMPSRTGCPEPSGPSRPPRRSHAVGIVIAMLVMVVLLLAAAVWSQWDSLSALFDPMPSGSRPGQSGAEKVSEEHPATDDAGVPWIDPDPQLPEQDMARALLKDAALDALELLYGDVAVSRSQAKETFCNLTAGGYESALDKAMEANSQTVGTISRWDGYAVSRPLMAGNCGYLCVAFYSLEGDRPPLDADFYYQRLCFLWTGSSWRVDASTQTDLYFHGDLFPDIRYSRELRAAELVSRFSRRLAQEDRIIQPVLPGTYDTMPTELYTDPDGNAVLEFWAFNGTDTPLEFDTLAEVSLRENEGRVYFELYDLPIETLRLAPGEGQLVTITIGPDQLENELVHNMKSFTCSVWLPY